MLLKPNADFYSSRHPNADDVLLLIEVADSSLAFDQNQKLRLYALHGIPEYWLLNLNDLSLEVYRNPNGEVYAEKTTLRAGDTITLSQLNEISIRIRGYFITAKNFTFSAGNNARPVRFLKPYRSKTPRSQPALFNTFLREAN